MIGAVVATLVIFQGPAASPTVHPTPGHESCGAASNLQLASVACHQLPTGGVSTTSAGPYVVSTELDCVAGAGRSCVPKPCPGGTLADGFQLIEHLSDGSTRPGCDKHSDNAASIAGPSPAQVAKAMRRLSWPASPLRIQPVNGRTLVNFRTNFYTTNTGPTTRTVTLLGRRITIEATPTYRWRWGDGGRASGTSAGAAYPHLLVTHEYLRKGVVHPRLDTVYSGRFRIGQGAWRAIPGTLTVLGTPQRLEVVTARPVLVNPYG